MGALDEPLAVRVEDGREAQAARSACPILVGGHHAQALPDYILQNPNVDIACIGEGEIALARAGRAAWSAGEDYTDIPTMWVKQDGIIHRNPMGELENELDKLPVPREAALVRVRLLQGQPRGLHGPRLPVQVHLLQHPLPARDLQREGRLPPQALDRERHGGVQAEPRQVRRPKFVSVHDDNFTTNPHVGRGVLRGLPEGSEPPLVLLRLPDHDQARSSLTAMKAANCAHHLHGRRLGRRGHAPPLHGAADDRRADLRRGAAHQGPRHRAAGLVHLRQSRRDRRSRCSRRSRWSTRSSRRRARPTSSTRSRRRSCTTVRRRARLPRRRGRGEGPPGHLGLPPRVDPEAPAQGARRDAREDHAGLREVARVR